MAKLDAVKNSGTLGNAEDVSSVLQKLRSDPDLGEATRAQLVTNMGDTIKDMYGIQPHEVKMMNGLPQHTRETIMHLCSIVTNHPEGVLTYTRGEGGSNGPSFSYEFKDVATPSKEGGDHDTHPELHFRCMK